MNLNGLPKDLQDNPEIQKMGEFIEGAFYDLLVDSGKTIEKSSGIGKNTMASIIFKTLTANLCKSAFDSAYVRYVSSGVMEE